MVLVSVSPPQSGTTDLDSEQFVDLARFLWSAAPGNRLPPLPCQSCAVAPLLGHSAAELRGITSTAHFHRRTRGAKKAETAFKEMGSRTPIEAEATLTVTLSLRRHWGHGLTFVREYARMRLARVCFVGAPRCIRTAQAFSSSHCAHDDHSVFSVHALHRDRLHARLRAH